MQAQTTTGLGQDVNILEAMEMFKGLPDQALPKYAQDPKLAIFAAAEMARRDDMRKRFQQRAQKPEKPVIAQLAESMSPTMPMMPPGMNAPQEQQPMQMAPSQMQEPQQPGIASLMPQQSFAGGGPVAFASGDLVGGSVLTPEELEDIRRRARQSGYISAQTQDALAERERRMIEQAEKQKAGREAQAETQRLGQRAVDAQSSREQRTQAPLVIPSQQASAPAPMGLEQIIALGKKANLPGISVPEPYETAGRASQILKDRQQQFPDEISPIMKQLKELYGKQPSQADIDKAANRQIALAMMGSKDRNFLSGLAGGLQAGEDVKKSMGSENRAMQQASLQAQLAHAKYQDAIRRGDYDAAQKAAQEERKASIEVQKIRRDIAVQDMEVGLGLARAMQPKGAAGEKGAFTQAQAAQVREKALALAAPEIQKLESDYEKEAKPAFGMFGGFEKNWRQGPKGQELEAKKQAIVNKYIAMLAPELGGVSSPSNADLQRYYQMGAR
jgi:hypothetical protein